MTTRQALRLTHLVSTIWFMACIGYILVLALHQAGFHWWLIFSLSGHSALVVFLLISLYLFALFRGVGEAQQIEVEHPLTTTSYYMGFYVAAPLLGGLAGTLGMMGVSQSAKFFLGVAMGTLGTTFVVWVIVDPIVGLAEIFLPTSRKHRLERFAQAEAQRRTRQEKREQLLAEAFAREEQERQRWQHRLRPLCRKTCRTARVRRPGPRACGTGSRRYRRQCLASGRVELHAAASRHDRHHPRRKGR